MADFHAKAATQDILYAQNLRNLTELYKIDPNQVTSDNSCNR